MDSRTKILHFIYQLDRKYFRKNQLKGHFKTLVYILSKFCLDYAISHFHVCTCQWVKCKAIEMPSVDLLKVVAIMLAVGEFTRMCTRAEG